MTAGNGERASAGGRTRIAFLIDRIGLGGGTENQVTLLINNLDPTRFEPYLVNLRPPRPDYAPSVKCPVIYLKVTKLFSIKTVVALWRFVWWLRRSHVDILQLYFVDSNIFGVIAGRLAGVASIVVNRRDMGVWHSARSLAWTNRVNRFVPYCIANAAAVKEFVIRHEPFQDEQIRVIHNGIDHENHWASPLTRRDLGLPEGVPLVGITANIRPVKRIDLFLRIAQRLSDRGWHFIVLGSGPPEHKIYRAMAASMGLSSIVTFYHTVDRALEVMALFDVGVLTSETEGLSNVLIEYALTGIPAIVFDTGGNSEIVVHGETGFVIPNDDEALMAEKIEYLINNREVRIRMGEAARVRARQEFNVAKMVRRTEAFYKEIAPCR